MSANESQEGGFSGAEIESVVNMVIESKFIEYIDSINHGIAPSSIKVSPDDFRKKISVVKDGAMCNHKGKKTKLDDSNMSNIERIRTIQEVYKFKNASKSKNQEKR